jgi:hypothetical protein
MLGDAHGTKLRPTHRAELRRLEHFLRQRLVVTVASNRMGVEYACNALASNGMPDVSNGSRVWSSSGNGVLIDTGSFNNTIGGETAGSRNVISGNLYTGVQIFGASAN